MFFIGGAIFLTIAFQKLLEEGIAGSYELFILGSIMFIPGSYHSFIALMAQQRVEGYSYDQVAVFEEDFHAEDWEFELITLLLT